MVMGSQSVRTRNLELMMSTASSDIFFHFSFMFSIIGSIAGDGDGCPGSVLWRSCLGSRRALLLPERVLS